MGIFDKIMFIIDNQELMLSYDLVKPIYEYHVYTSSRSGVRSFYDDNENYVIQTNLTNCSLANILIFPEKIQNITPELFRENYFQYNIILSDNDIMLLEFSFRVQELNEMNIYLRPEKPHNLHLLLRDIDKMYDHVKGLVDAQQI